MKIPSEAELIEIERRIVRLVNHAEKSRARAEKLWSKANEAEDEARVGLANKLNRQGNEAESLADDIDAILGDVEQLVELARAGVLDAR